MRQSFSVQISFKELGINLYFFPLTSSENGSNLFHFLGENLSQSFTECYNILKGKTKLSLLRGKYKVLYADILYHTGR